LEVIIIRETNDEETDKSKLYFKSKTYTLLSKEDLTDHDVNESFQNQFVSSMNTSQEIPVGHCISQSLEYMLLIMISDDETNVLLAILEDFRTTPLTPKLLFIGQLIC
jgi:hypothetical protein